MLKLYNDKHQFIRVLTNLRQLYITDTLARGAKSLYFELPCTDEFTQIIQEEFYIETSDYSFVIKEIIFEENDFFKVYCSPNVEDLYGKIYKIFDGFKMNLEQLYNYCLINTGWTLQYNSDDKTVATYQVSNVNSMSMIEIISEDYGKEYWFDTKNKILKIYDKMGSSLGAYFSNELKLKQLKSQSSTYDFATILYPYGKDGLSIKNINGNKEYITNFTYSSKRIEKIMIDEEIEIAELLLEKAEDYLKEISQPRASYKLMLSDIDAPIGIGDEIIIVDKLKKIKQKQRVVKIKRYPMEPERDVVEISNLPVDLVQLMNNSNKEIRKQIQYLKKLYGDK